MKTLTLWIVVVAAVIGSGLSSAKPVIGQPAPSFSVADTRGNQVSLDDYAGKVVILEWTNHLCPFVEKHYASGNMQALQEKYTGEGVVWLSVISSAPGKQGHVSAQEADRLTTSRAAKPSRVLMDAAGTVGRLYAAKTTPHMYIIDSKGTLRYMGAIDSINSANVADIERATNYVEQGMTELLAGAVISKPVTRAYGCTVKY
ncbi:redoxin domain-containing protein [Exilibacterium tricleocarpae]|uniref:Redoxin domain-containing protein n=1 Tax=Exilibacterium tricleocarpae TaxID=2591008 RepID=A0A545U5E0_9GAMM|nr:redoxin domain-containing protein [Exilibacterium tricleocarpae]TQV84689.1 redoxin domain-containing protein [Exilibacterium tricleocarpae]